MSIVSLLETVMLVCFGLAWPFANLRMLRHRRAEGKGLGFTTIILVGYVAGAAAKCLQSPAGPLPVAFWLFAINGSSVALNLALQWLYRPRAQPGAGLRGQLRRSRP